MHLCISPSTNEQQCRRGCLGFSHATCLWRYPCGIVAHCASFGPWKSHGVEATIHTASSVMILWNATRIFCYVVTIGGVNSGDLSLVLNIVDNCIALLKCSRDKPSLTSKQLIAVVLKLFKLWNPNHFIVK